MLKNRLIKDWGKSDYKIELSVSQLLACTGAGCNVVRTGSFMRKIVDDSVKIVLKEDNGLSDTSSCKVCVDIEKYIMIEEIIGWVANDENRENLIKGVKFILDQDVPVIMAYDGILMKSDTVVRNDRIIIRDTCTDIEAHAMIIIGYEGDEWIVQNSYGDHFHKDGILRMRVDLEGIIEYYCIRKINVSEKLINYLKSEWR